MTDTVRYEEFDKQLRDILSRAAEVGREAERAATESDRRIVARRIATKPNFFDELADDLRLALESEVVVAKPLAQGAAIEPREEHREIAKRALAHIKLPRLRDIAENLGLTRSGNFENVAQRIVLAYKADEEAIARLIVEYETEPPPERRFTTRIFGLTQSASDINATASRVELFSQRYIRVGVAKWFVITHSERQGNALVLYGDYRYYRADADRSEEDTYRLRAERADAAAELRVRESHALVRAISKGEAEGRAVLAAFAHATKLRPQRALSFGVKPASGSLMRLDERSTFLLDLLASRFRSQHVQVHNLTSAGFEMARGHVEVEASDRPAVQAVRLQGQHLLDSRPACELLSAGQALVDLSLLVRFSTGPDTSVLLPVTIKVARDHLVVMTGFGTHPPKVANDLQNQVVRGVEQALESGPFSRAALERLASAIEKRARQEEPVEHADLFTDESPSSKPTATEEG